MAKRPEPETGRQIREWLHRRHQTQTWLAIQLGVSLPYLNQIINGKRMPSLTVAAEIERVVGIPPREFLVEAVQS